jgi:hypothetical protein
MSLIQTYAQFASVAGDTSSIYSSPDNGVTWNPINSFNPHIFVDGSFIRGSLHTHKYNHNKVFFAGCSSLGTTRIVRSFNQGISAFIAGGNWSIVATNDFTNGSFLNGRFSSASIDDIYLIGDQYLYKSSNKGFTFNYVGLLNNILNTTITLGTYRDVFFANQNVGIISVYDEVYTTIDGGTTWNILPVIPSVIIRSAIIDSTGLNINLLEESGLNFTVYNSIDGGVTWTSFTAVGSARRFLPCLDDPNTLYIEKRTPQTSIYKSVNFGINWVQIVGSASTTVNFFNNDCASTGTGLADFSTYRTINGGVTYTQQLAGLSRLYAATATSYECGCPPDSITIDNECIWGEPSCYTTTPPYLEGTECYSEAPIPCCYSLIPCILNGGPIQTNEVLTPGIGQYVGQVVKIESSNSCYQVTVTDSICDEGIAVVVESVYEDCYGCNPVYMLTACNDVEPPIISPLYTTQVEFADYLGQVVWIDSSSTPAFRTCYFVGIGPYDATVGTLPSVTQSFDSCELCGYYRLINCLDQNDILYSLDTTLNTYLDKVGKYNDACYQVEFVNGYIDEEFINNPFTENPYEDCACCTYTPPEPEFKKYTRVIPEPVREFYRIAQSKCHIETYVKYGVAWYSEYMKIAQGINTCVDVDVDKIWLKMKLQELSLLNDETACTTTSIIPPEECDEPTGWQPTFQ